MFRVATAVYQAGVKTRMTHRAGACKGLDFTWNSASIWNRAIYTIHCSVLDFTHICNPLLTPLNCHRPWHYLGCRFHTACDKSFSSPFFSCVTVWHAGSCAPVPHIRNKPCKSISHRLSNSKYQQSSKRRFVTNDPGIGWPCFVCICNSQSQCQSPQDLTNIFPYLKWWERPI